MSNDEVIRRLEELKSHIPDRTPEEQDAIEQEIASIDETIQEYDERISVLEGKTSDLENYKYTNTEPRDFTEELLEESFARQLDELDREDEEYKELQSIGEYILNSYIEEIAVLNEEIASIERRLRKNDFAVSKNMRVQLSAEEVQELNDTLESKRTRLSLCESMKEQYSTDINDYSQLLTVNEQKRQLLVDKQDRLKDIRENKQGMINHSKLLDDKAEIIMLKSGIEALESKKENLSYDKKSEIDALINEIKESKEVESVENMKEEPIADSEPELTEDAQSEIDNSTVTGGSDETSQNLYVEDYTILPEDKQENNDVVLAGISLDTGDLDSTIDPKEKNSDYQPCFMDEETYKQKFLADDDLDFEREATFEDAEELKEKKKDNKVIAFIREHKRKFIAAGIALVVLATASIKGCTSLKQLSPQQSDELDNDGSYSQQYEEDEQTELGDNTSDEPIVEEQPDLEDNMPDEPIIDEQPGLEDNTPDEPVVEEQPGLEDNTPDEPIIDEQPGLEDNTPDEPVVDEQPGLGDNTPDEPNTVILSEGESVSNVSDIFGNNESIDTQTDTDNFEQPVIEHGDEVGKTLDSGTELVDYTEDGKAVVELGDTETKVIENPDKTFHETLEDFFGGPITITDFENSYDEGEIEGPSRTR